MNLPVTLPSWLPPWAAFAVLVPILLYGLVFLLMPFSVIGLRARLDVIEARLDEVQGEIRTLSLRLPAPGYDEDDERLASRRSGRDRPPIPPSRTRAGTGAEDEAPELYAPPPVARASLRPAPIPVDPRRRPAGRAEPRLEWRD